MDDSGDRSKSQSGGPPPSACPPETLDPPLGQEIVPTPAPARQRHPSRRPRQRSGAQAHETGPRLYRLRRLMPHKHDQRPWAESGLGSKVEVCLWCGRMATEGFGDGQYLTHEEWLPLVRGWED